MGTGFGQRRRLARSWEKGALPVLLLLLLSQGPAAADPQALCGLYADVSHEVGLDFSHDNGMTGELYFVEMMGAGGAFLDYDADGDLDVYLVQGGPLGPEARGKRPSDRLFRNDLETLPDGRQRLRFTDVTAEAGLAGATGYGMGVAVGDYDGNGFPDLYLANFGPNQLWRNRGDGRFEEVTGRAGADDPRWSVAASFTDVDRDGRLDLFIVNYVDFTLATHKICRSHTGARDYCSPLAYAPEPDRLLKNLGDGTFADVSAASGIEALPGTGLGVVSGDFNGDGFADLYVANDAMANRLWINQRDGTFVDEALLAGVALDEEGRAEAGMGVDAGDFDGDGDEDLIVTHLTRETHTLYVDEGGGLFIDGTTAAGLGAATWPFTGFGVAFVDVDNDGRLDLAAVNGAVRHLPELVAAGDPFPLHQRDQLFWNRGGRFEEVTGCDGSPFAMSEVSRGLAVGDVDNDGDADLLVTHNRGPARLLLNRSGRHRWLGLRLVTGQPPWDALGARAVVERPGAPPLARRVRTDGSYVSARDARLLFGLGDRGGPVTVRVRWPGGREERFAIEEVDRYLTLAEGSGEAAPSQDPPAASGEEPR